MASPIKTLKAKKFLPMLKARQARFSAAPADLPAGTDSSRIIAKALHPRAQYLKVDAVTKRADD